MLLRFQGAPILTLTRLFRLCFGATDRDGSRSFCTPQRCCLSRGFPLTDVEKMPNRDPKEQQEFDRLVAIINEGVTVWNDWRDSHPGMAIDLSDVQLRGADLRGINLTGAILWHADLRGSNLVEANLIRVRLF